MKKITFAILVFTTIVTSCKKNNDAVAVVPEPTRINLTTRSVLQAGTNDSIVRTFTYDATNRITFIDQTGNSSNAPRTLSFSYNTDGTLAYYDDNLLGRYRIVYNAAGKIINKNAFTVSGATETPNGIYAHTYNGTIVTRNYTPKTGNGSINTYSYDANGNVIEVKSYTKSSPTDMVGTLSGTEAYSNYDTKKYANLAYPTALLFPENSVNNFGSYNYGSSTINYVYEYNTDGYVTKRTNNTGSVNIYQYRRL